MRESQAKRILVRVVYLPFSWPASSEDSSGYAQYTLRTTIKREERDYAMSKDAQLESIHDWVLGVCSRGNRRIVDGQYGR